MPPSSVTHPAACSCCGGPALGGFDRRRFLQLAGGAALGATFPFTPSAAQIDYELLLITCTDPRVQPLTAKYMDGRDLAGKYRQISIDGAAIGVVAEQFRDRQKIFWDDIAAFIDRYRIKKLIALDHRDCGAAKVAYGLTNVTDKLIETESHHYALKEFRKQVVKRYRDMDVEIGLMTLDGKVQIFPPLTKAPPPETARAPKAADPASMGAAPPAENAAPANTITPPVSAPEPVSLSNTATLPAPDTPR